MANSPLTPIRFNAKDRELIAEAKSLSSLKTTAEVIREGLKLFVKKLRRQQKTIP